VITMTQTHKKRLSVVLLIVIGVSASVALALTALNQNMNLFYTPTQIKAGEASMGHMIRLGGFIEKGSVQRASDSLLVNFTVTDCDHTVLVQYTGILPDLFREGQGVVTDGRIQANGTFKAETVLAKHDENYVPPELADTLKNNACYQSGHAQKSVNSEPESKL